MVVSFEITRDDGQVFVIDDTAWRIPSDGLDGWHELDVSIGTLDNVTRDGGFVTNQHVGMVYRTITAELRDVKTNQAGRRQAEHFFIPKHSYTVKATYMGRTRKCEGVQSAFTLSQGNVHQPVVFVWTILCPDPYMTSTEPVESTTVFASEPRFGFPYVSLKYSATVFHDEYEQGFITGIRRNNQFSPGIDEDRIRIITNGGDVESAPKFMVELLKMQQTSNVDILITRLYNENPGGTPIWSKGAALRIDNIPSYSNSQSGTSFLKMEIDLSKRPFKVLADGKELQFTLADDGLLRDPYAPVGDSCYEIRMYDRTGEIVSANDVYFDVSIEPRFTGV